MVWDQHLVSPGFVISGLLGGDSKTVGKSQYGREHCKHDFVTHEKEAFEPKIPSAIHWAAAVYSAAEFTSVYMQSGGCYSCGPPIWVLSAISILVFSFRVGDKIRKILWSKQRMLSLLERIDTDALLRTKSMT